MVQPGAIPILEQEAETSEPETIALSSASRKTLREALAGFVAWSPVVTLRPGDPPFRARAVELAMVQRQVVPEGENQPPLFDARLELRVQSKTFVVDEATRSPISQYIARAFAAPSGLVVERTLSTAAEGSYITRVDAWSCDDAGCSPVM